MNIMLANHQRTTGRPFRFITALAVLAVVFVTFSPPIAASQARAHAATHGEVERGRSTIPGSRSISVGEKADRYARLESLSGTASISGRVIDGTEPVAYCHVLAYDADDGSPGGGDETDGSGDFSITGLESGRAYRVLFSPGDFTHAYEWYSDAPSWSSSAVVVAPAAAIDASLEDGVSISGTVRVEGDGGASGCEVYAYDPTGGFWLSSGFTSDSGAYTVEGLRPGVAYKLFFNWSFQSEWFDNKGDWGHADLVSAPGTGVNAMLDAGPAISGTVTDGSGPVNACDVSAYDSESGLCVGGDSTDAEGVYLIGGLDPGRSYKVLFVPASGARAYEWYGNAGSWSGATAITVPRSAVNAVLDSSVSISGMLIPEEGGVISHGYVGAYDPNLEHEVKGVTADPSGNYSLGGLRAGVSYKLHFWDTDGSHVSQWYAARVDWSAADPVTAPSSGINGVLVQSAPSPSIVGTVTADASPVEGCEVVAYDAGNGFPAANRFTDGEGHYTIDGLIEGHAYRVFFSPVDGTQAYEWYGDAATWSSAATVTASAAGIDAELDDAVAISGKVSALDGGPITGCTVAAFDATGELLIQATQSDLSGDYAINHLRAGTSYKVRFYESQRPYKYVPEWYDGKVDWTTADLVAAPHTGINAELSRAGSISGQVTDGISGEPVAACRVEVFDSATQDLRERASTDASGEYLMEGLSSGDYKVHFVPDNGRNLAQWYHARADFQSADEVPVVAPAESTHIDAALAVSGGISGVVSEERTGKPIRGCRVYVRDAVTDSLVETSLTGSNGRYAIGGLRAGRYKVEYRPEDGFHRGEWYRDCASKDNAMPVEVASSATTEGIDAALWGPNIVSVSPSSVYRGRTVDVEIVGDGTRFTGASKVVISGKGISIDHLVVLNASRARASITISGDVATGKRDVNVVTGTETPIPLVRGLKIDEPPPPEPGPTATYYLAEGSSDHGFDTYVTILNPNSSPVTAQVTYMTEKGPRRRPDLRLAAMSQTVINPRNDIGQVDFSTMVTCREGKTISVDRRMLWTGSGALSPEGHASIGVAAPSKDWYLAEGSSRWGFETWLLIQNPGTRPATCRVTYMLEGKGPASFVKTVPPSSRRTFDLASDIGKEDASIKVESNQPVIAERAMYRNKRREGHDSIGATKPAATFYLSEGSTDHGFTTYVLVQNPGSSPVNVRVTYMTGGGRVPQPTFRMPANSRKTIRVNDVLQPVDFSTLVSADRPIVAERAMYWGAESRWGEACHDSIGLPSPHTTFYLPDGETANGYETYTLVQNPNPSAVRVQVSYLTPTGKGTKTFIDSIPANARRTYSMADLIPSGRAAVVVTSKTSGRKVMVERAMYWNSRGAGTDTLGGFSD